MQPMPFTNLPDLPRPISGQFVGVVEGTLLCAGGSLFPVSLFAGGKKVWLRDLLALRPGDRAWRYIGGISESGPCGYGVAQPWRGSLILAGGADASQHYGTVTQLRAGERGIEQVRLPDLPRPLAYCSGAILGDTLYVFGGQESPTATEARRELYALDLTSPTPRWKTLPTLPGRGRILAPLAAIGGRLVVASGADLAPGPDGKPLRSYLNDAWSYSPRTGWEPLPEVPYACVAAPVCAYRKRLLIFGGDDGANAPRVQELKDSHPGFRRTILAFDGHRWQPAGDYPSGLVTTHAVLWQNAPVIVGGEDRPGHRQAHVLHYQP